MLKKRIHNQKSFQGIPQHENFSLYELLVSADKLKQHEKINVF